MPTLVGSGFGAFGYYAGMATTKGLSAFKPEIYYLNLNPQVPALFQPRAVNIVPGAVGVSVGGIASGTAPMGENFINSLFPPPPKR